ncbi:hypothetical protein MCOR25_011167 [Pyricularia grisea]|nr:hypothetical protein MCOR25_011167 [Pyricularia grisea]
MTTHHRSRIRRSKASHRMLTSRTTRDLSPVRRHCTTQRSITPIMWRGTHIILRPFMDCHSIAKLHLTTIRSC